MDYRITVDGREMVITVPIREYSLEADNLVREEIIRHYLDEEGAKEVVIHTGVKKETDHEEQRDHRTALSYQNVRLAGADISK